MKAAGKEIIAKRKATLEGNSKAAFAKALEFEHQLKEMG